MTTKLHFRRDETRARNFEKEALDAIWQYPEVGGFYPPAAKTKYRLQAMVLQDDDRGTTEETVSIIFILSSGANSYLEVAVQVTPGKFEYGGFILVPSVEGDDIQALNGLIEDTSFNDHFIISVMKASSRMLYGRDKMSGRYRELITSTSLLSERAISKAA